MPTLDQVPENTPLVKVRCVPLDNADVIAIYVTKYETVDGISHSYYMKPDGEWQEYEPYATLEAFHRIEGRIEDPLRKVAAELTEMIRDRLWDNG